MVRDRHPALVPFIARSSPGRCEDPSLGYRPRRDRRVIASERRRTASSRPRSTPRVVLAVAAVAVVIAVVAVMLVNGRPSPEAQPRLPQPSPVPTETFQLQRIGGGVSTGWLMSEALVGPRDVAIDADGTLWITEQNRGIVDTFVDG